MRKEEERKKNEEKGSLGMSSVFFFFFFFFPFSRQRTLVISILRRFPSLRRLPPMSFFQRVVHHLVNEVLVSGLANRCGFWKSLRRRAVFLFFFGVVVQIRSPFFPALSLSAPSLFRGFR